MFSECKHKHESDLRILTAEIEYQIARAARMMHSMIDGKAIAKLESMPDIRRNAITISMRISRVMTTIAGTRICLNPVKPNFFAFTWRKMRCQYNKISTVVDTRNEGPRLS